MTKESLSDKRGEFEDEPKEGFYYEKNVKEFIKDVEMDLLKRFKLASIPIMEIIKKRAGKDLI